MVEIMRNTGFRMLFILIPTIFFFFKKQKIRLDWYIIGYLYLTLVSEIFTFYHTGYNLIHYSIFVLVNLIFISVFIYQETNKRIVLFISTILPITSLIFFLTTDHSSLDIVDIVNVFPVRSPLDTQQYFDFNGLINLCFVLVTFIWLYDVVSQTQKLEGGLTKRFIYIFGFLGYFAGSFFTIAFGRYIIGDIAQWFEYWNKIYLPLYLLFILTLNIGLLWTPTPSSSS